MRVLEFERAVYEMEKQIESIKMSLKEKKDEELLNYLTSLKARVEKLKSGLYKNLTRWQKVQIARHPDRPHAVDYIYNVLTEFSEIHGDKAFRDDPSIIAGFANLNGNKIAVIAEEKGRNTKEKIYRNFGMPHPEGYRKARRIMEMADRYGLPLLSLIDTPGAYPGMDAEERGQSMAIAENLRTMLKIHVPFVAVIIGEGGSGGALAIGLGNTVLAMEYAMYSVISPEGCASILWKDAGKANEAAEALKLTAQDLLKFGVIDGIIPEPVGGAHWDIHAAMSNFKTRVMDEFERLSKLSGEDLLASRREKYRKTGVFTEEEV